MSSDETNAPIAFTKMHGLGNDFMVIDNRGGDLRLDAARIRRLADRHTGIGFDQLLVVESPSVDDVEFDYRIYNADGGEVEHCGNGARCFARFVHDRGMTENRRIPVHTANGTIVLVLLDDGRITVQMGVPDFRPDRVPLLARSGSLYYELDIAGESVRFGAVSIGNPHALIVVDDIDAAPVETLGAQMQVNPFFPRRVNVGFLEVLSRERARLRVFERGVGETRACGTGACAAVAIAHRQGLLGRHAIIELVGGELEITWPEDEVGGRAAPIEMTGPCSTVFEGLTRL